MEKWTDIRMACIHSHKYIHTNRQTDVDMHTYIHWYIQTDRKKDKKEGRKTERQKDKRTEGQKDRQADRLTEKLTSKQVDKKFDRKTERQADRKTGKVTDRQMDRFVDTLGKQGQDRQTQFYKKEYKWRERLSIVRSTLSVELKGGVNAYEGNVMALNPSTKIFGPVCDTIWTKKNVSQESILTEDQVQ